MKKLIVLTVGAMFVTACGGTQAPEASTQPMGESPVAMAEADVSAAAPRAPEPAPEAPVVARRPAARPAAPRPSEHVETPVTARAAAEPLPAPPTLRSIPEYREVVIPAGTSLPLTLASAVASDESEVEDRVQATLREDMHLADGSVLPRGTEALGRVIEVERAGRVKGRARVAFRFTRLTYDGDEYDVRTEAVERVAAATKGEDATKVGIGAGAGAALGALLGGGSGAAKGAAIGAAAGTGAVLATRGEEVRLEPGEPVDTRLTAALPVRVRVR